MSRLIKLQLAYKIAGNLLQDKDHGCWPCFFRRVWKWRVLLMEVWLLERWGQLERRSSWPLLSRENSWTADIFISCVSAQLHRWALQLYNKSPAFQCTQQASSVTWLKTFRTTRSLNTFLTNGPVCFLIPIVVKLRISGKSENTCIKSHVISLILSLCWRSCLAS